MLITRSCALRVTCRRADARGTDAGRVLDPSEPRWQERQRQRGWGGVGGRGGGGGEGFRKWGCQCDVATCSSSVTRAGVQAGVAGTGRASARGHAVEGTGRGRQMGVAPAAAAGGDLGHRQPERSDKAAATKAEALGARGVGLASSKG